MNKYTHYIKYVIGTSVTRVGFTSYKQAAITSLYIVQGMEQLDKKYKYIAILEHDEETTPEYTHYIKYSVDGVETKVGCIDLEQASDTGAYIAFGTEDMDKKYDYIRIFEADGEFIGDFSAC